MLYGLQSSGAKHPHQLFDLSQVVRGRPTGLLQSIGGNHRPMINLHID